MSSLAHFRTRLLADGTPFALVSGASALAQVKDGGRPPALPAAYVLTARDASAPNERMTGRVLQRNDRDIMVVIVVEHLGDAGGADAQDPLEEAIGWVRDQFIGFLPPEAVDPTTHVAGEVVEAVNGCVWFQDTFSAPIYLKEKL